MAFDSGMWGFNLHMTSKSKLGQTFWTGQAKLISPAALTNDYGIAGAKSPEIVMGSIRRDQ